MIFGENIFSASVLPNLFSSAPTPTLPQRGRETGRGLTFLEQKLIAFGLMNINSLDTSIKVSLKYSTEDNFLHKNMYGELKNCYLQKEIAEKVVKAQKLLKEKYPFYSLIIYDGVRPLSIQQMMWDEVQVPEKLKDKYVSNPEVGSLHNFGCAVDVSIVNEEGWEMDMGTPYDYFGELGHPIAEQRMIDEGKLTWRQFENRKLLRDVMTEAGFTPITTEWWHFNGSSLKIAGEKYHIVD
ncbi:MAG: M15 family metallopeptidase [Bacteroidetes bacterium]|nr:M15 family metallopeptidase [Bacteroidota bacterium]